MREWWCRVLHRKHHIRMMWVYDKADEAHWHCCKCGRDWYD